MAKWRGKCAGYEVWINDIDHPPPHLHVILEGRNRAVHLYTLEIRNPPPHQLPPRLRRELRALHGELMEAWEQVRIIPPGSNTHAW